MLTAASQVVYVAQGGGWKETAIAIGTIVGAAGFVAAAVGTFPAWTGLKENSKGRHAQRAIELGRRWDDPTMASVRRTIEKFGAGEFRSSSHEMSRRYYGRLGRIRGKPYADLDAYATVFEDLGVLNTLDILNTEWIDETLGGAVLGSWLVWHLVAKEERALNPKTYENRERLAHRIWARREANSQRDQMNSERRGSESRRRREREAAAAQVDPLLLRPW